MATAAKKPLKVSTNEVKDKDKEAFSEKDECGICDKSVGSKDSIQCEICDKWHHSKCVGINTEVYEFISANEQTHWFCKGCNSGTGQIIKEIKRLQEKIDCFEQTYIKQKAEGKKELDKYEQNNEKNRLEVSSQLEKMVKDIKEIQKELTSVVQNANIQIDNSAKIQEKKWSEVICKQVDSELKTRATDVGKMQEALQQAKEKADDIQDKEHRRNNIIIYRVPESNADSAEEKYKEDEKFCLGIFNAINSGVVEEDITKVIRLGRRDDTTAKHARPLMVKLEGRHQKNLVMENLSKLKHADAKYKAVKVSHDLTPKERDEIKALVVEAKDKTAQETSGEWIHVVRGKPEHMKIIRVRRNW